MEETTLATFFVLVGVNNYVLLSILIIIVITDEVRSMKPKPTGTRKNNNREMISQRHNVNTYFNTTWPLEPPMPKEFKDTLPPSHGVGSVTTLSLPSNRPEIFG